MNQIGFDPHDGWNTTNRLIVALPKGRLLEPTLALLERAGFPRPDIGNGSRRLIADGPEGLLRYLLAKPADVPVYVEYGGADLGVVGQDALRESGRDVYEPLTLGFGHCRLVVAAPHDRRPLNLKALPALRVATKYPRLAKAFFSQRGISAEIIPLSGSIELAPAVGLADLIVDVTETGNTLRENNLVEIEEIQRCQACLIVNRASYRLRTAEVGEFMRRIQEAI